MDVQFFVVVLCTLLELAASMGHLRSPHRYSQILPDPSVVIAYNRSTEIEKHCSPFLNSASELESDYNMRGRLENQLSFYLGDWEQENDGAPIMQLDDEGIPESSQSLTESPLKLVSFEVKDVNSVPHFKNAVSLGGVLSLGISRNSSFAYNRGLEPRMRPGSSVMPIVFEGVYTETKENGGEGLLCLLGSSTSTPSNDRCECDESMAFASGYAKPYDNHRQLRFLEDDQILLVLRYPKTFMLTKRAIQGEMVSLNKQGGSKYFSKVSISSQLNGGGHRKYQFSPEFYESRNFDPSPYQAELMEDGVLNFKAGEFCRLLDFVSQEVLNIFPNYKFNARSSNMSQIHGKLGPFLLGKVTEATGGLIYDDIKLLFQHVLCEEDSSGRAKVSAVLRAFPEESLHPLELFRTGLSGLTLTAEGIWNSSSGQLFMVGCDEGELNSRSEGCDYEIVMYFPRAFSIKQRSFLFGSISSLKKDKGFDNPLLFNAMISPTSFMDRISWHIAPYDLSYNYSKTKLVNEFERRSLPHQIFTIVKLLFFQYPALKDAEEPSVQLRMLAGNLGLHGYVVPDQYQLIDGQKSRMLVEITVLSLGPLLGWYEYNPHTDKYNGRKMPVVTKEDLTSSRFFNVSMHLNLMFKTKKNYRQTTYKNVSELSLEGLYDPTFGEMHLVGCRKALVESTGIERGQDCLIEVKIQYPPKNFQWKSPTAKITISSQRQEDDPLYFSLIDLDALLTHYPDYSETISYPEYFEGIFCILMLAGSVAIIWSQFLYMKVDANIVPFISTSMLAFQILGYSLPLICGVKVLLKSKDSHPEFGKLKVFESIQNALLLVATLLTARLLQMVTESLNQSLKGPPKRRYGAKKKQVILGSIALCIFGFLIWFAARDNPDVNLHPGDDMHPPRNMHKHQTWMDVTEDFAYFLQDFFLLPQILSNLWMPMPVKSLREAYYLGFTSIRLLVHFLDNNRGPDVHPKRVGSELTSPNSTSPLFAKVAAPTAIIISAIIVYIQQNFKYHKHIHSS